MKGKSWVPQLLIVGDWFGKYQTNAIVFPNKNLFLFLNFSIWFIQILGPKILKVELWFFKAHFTKVIEKLKLLGNELIILDLLLGFAKSVFSLLVFLA